MIGLDRWEELKVIIIHKKTLDSDQVEQKKKKKETFCVKRKVVGPRALGGYYTSSHITYTGEVKVKEEQLILIKAETYRARINSYFLAMFILLQFLQQYFV